jgi:hypothetical protein
MGPSAKRIAILITELMVFFIVTAFTTHFISYAGALQLAPTDKPPAYFPVIAYDGNREHPDAKNYLVVPWSEWEGVAAKRPGASLLLPERAGSVRLGENSKASFTADPDGESRQAVVLTWTANNGEQQVRYVAQARTVEPRYYRTVTTNTLLLGAAIGFVAGLLSGRAMRRRWLAQPGYYAPPSQQG